MAAAGVALAARVATFAQATGELAIVIRLDRGKQGQAPADGAVIWLPGVRGAGAPARPAVKQREKAFVPHVIAVRKGTVVDFPNDDRIYHNVFSQTPGAEFDLGLFRDGASRSVRFDKQGLVRVFCNIHAQMASNVMVLDDAAFAVTDATGSARIGGLPPGRHAVKLWHEMAGESAGEVQVPSGGAGRLELTLDASRFVVQPHKNKHGQDYANVDRY